MKLHCLPLSPSPALIVLTLALALTGCIHSTTNVNVRKDGSGTIEERVIMTAAALNMLKQFAQGFGQALGDENSQSANPDNPMIQDNAKYAERATRLGESVTFVSAEEITDANGGKGALVRYAFKDIRKVKLTQKDTMSAMDAMKSQVPQPGQVPGLPKPEEEEAKPVTFDFEGGSVATLKINFPRPDEEKSAGPGDLPGTPSDKGQPGPAEMAQMKQILGGLGFALLVTVDGEVVESSATHQEGNTATLFSMDFDKMLDDPDSFMKLQQLGDEKDFDKVKEALKDIPGMKFETGDAVIKFK